MNHGCRRTAFARLAALGVFIVAALVSPAVAQVPSPETFFGFQPGADGRLASWSAIEQYFNAVAQSSDRVDLLDAGPTTEGRRLLAAIITSPENLRNLGAIKAANQRLADPRTLAPDDGPRIIESQPVVLAIGCGIHASEFGATQTAPALLHELATGTDDRTMAWLRDIVVILFPSLNPDGHTLVVDWHDQVRDTPFDNATMPWLYHKYAGHDINRDAFMLNLAENRSLASFFYREWHPQVFLALHQMGTNGPRLFVPPMYDPIPDNIDPLLWRQAGLLGHEMAVELERDNRRGVITSALFDYDSPGYEDSSRLFHNVISLLAEAASAHGSRSIQIAPAELNGNQRGFPEHRRQSSFPNPWPGGEWRPRDIIEYFMSAARGLLDGVSRRRAPLLDNFLLVGHRAIERGNAGEPFAFVIPADQHDPVAAARLINVLIGNGVEVYRAEEPFRAMGEALPRGTDVVLMAQPFRAIAKTLLERQVYPIRRTGPGGAIELPYDVAAWTLPLQMGVQVVRAEFSFELPLASRLTEAVVAKGQVWGERRPGHYVIDGRGLAGALAVQRLLGAGLEPAWTRQAREVDGYTYPPGSIVVRATREAREPVERLTGLGLRISAVKGRPPGGTTTIGRVRTGLYKPWLASVDEGWTRWVLEQYEVPFENVTDRDMRSGGLRSRFDAIILPSETPERLREGQQEGRVPPEYAGGLGAEGIDALRAFVEAGGTLIALDRSTALAIDMLDLPVTNAVAALEPEDYSCPGSLVRLTLDPSHPLSFGLAAEPAAMVTGGAAFDIVGGSDRVRVAARYGHGDPLLSGLLIGPEKIADRGALVEVRFGAGRVVLFGFRPQHRGQSLGTFRTLLNAILLAGL